MGALTAVCADLTYNMFNPPVNPPAAHLSSTWSSSSSRTAQPHAITHTDIIFGIFLVQQFLNLLVLGANLATGNVSFKRAFPKFLASVLAGIGAAVVSLGNIVPGANTLINILKHLSAPGFFNAAGIAGAVDAGIQIQEGKGVEKVDGANSMIADLSVVGIAGFGLSALANSSLSENPVLFAVLTGIIFGATVWTGTRNTYENAKALNLVGICKKRNQLNNEETQSLLNTSSSPTKTKTSTLPQATERDGKNGVPNSKASVNP